MEATDPKLPADLPDGSHLAAIGAIGGVGIDVHAVPFVEVEFLCRLEIDLNLTVRHPRQPLVAAL